MRHAGSRHVPAWRGINPYPLEINREEVYMLAYLPVLTGPLVVIGVCLTGALVQALRGNQ